MKYRVFTNDRGPHSYSAFCAVDGYSESDATQKAKAKVAGLQNFGGRPLRVLLIPEKQAAKIDDAVLAARSRELYSD